MDDKIKNDYFRIALLEFKANRSKKEAREFERLLKEYPSYDLYKHDIINVLKAKEFLYASKQSEVGDGFGGFIPDGKEPEKCTTEKGIIALSSQEYVSEIASEKREKRNKRLWDIALLVIGGVITLIAQYVLGLFPCK